MVEGKSIFNCEVFSLKVQYVRKCFIDDPKATILFLNGWGGSSLSWKNNLDVLAKDFDCIAVDFPGFGISADPIEPWDVYKYADFLEDFRKTINLETFVLIGKSFGGRVSIAYAAKYGSVLNKLVLVSAAGLEGRSFKPSLLIVCAKILKNIFMLFGENTFQKVRCFFYKLFGLKIESLSYKREIMNKIVTQDLTPEASKISIPTLIIWGLQDAVLPIRVGRRLAKKIEGSQLEILEDGGHFINENHSEKFNSLILNFLRLT